MIKFIFALSMVFSSVASFAQNSPVHCNGGNLTEFTAYQTLLDLKVYVQANPASVGSNENALKLLATMEKIKIVFYSQPENRNANSQVQAIVEGKSELYQIKSYAEFTLDVFAEEFLLLNDRNPEMLYEQTINAAIKLSGMDFKVQATRPQPVKTFELKIKGEN